MATPTPQDLLTQLQGAQTALNQKTGKNVTLPSPTAPVKPAKVPSPSDPVDASRLGESPLKAPTVTPTQSLGLQDYIASINEGNKATQKEADKLQKEQTKAKSAISSIYDKLTNSGQRAEEIYKQEGVDTARRQVDEYTNQLEAEQLANTRRQQELDKNVEGLFGGALAAAKDKANRESLSKQADLAILQNAAVRKYDTASAIAQRKIDLELEPLKTQLDALKFFYTENKAELSTKEQRLYESKIMADQATYDEAKTSATTLQNTKLALLQTASSRNAPSDILNAIQSAQTPEEAMQAAGQYSSDSKNQVVKLDNGSTVIVDVNTGQIVKNLGGQSPTSLPVSGEYAGVISGAISLVPATKRDSTRQGIESALASGDYATAYANIANAVEDGLTGTNKTKFADARTDIGVMTGMRDAIQAFADAGGDMGYLKGSADKIAKNFGQLATDPRFASLAIQLEREFQSYRNNMTGAAFSPQESKEYASVNPRGNATLDLNLATIDGALAQLSNRVTSTVNARLPEAQKIYDKVVPPKTQGSTQTLSVDDAYNAYLQETGQSVSSGYKPFNFGNIFGN